MLGHTNHLIEKVEHVQSEKPVHLHRLKGAWQDSAKLGAAVPLLQHEKNDLDGPNRCKKHLKQCLVLIRLVEVVGGKESGKGESKEDQERPGGRVGLLSG
jgi:hypothetical protein